MALTLEDVKKPSKIISDSANELVKSHLKTIDMAIKSTPRRLGWNSIICELPTSFPLEGLSKTAGQTLIYSLIIEDLKKRPFEVKLDLKKDKTFLGIRFEVTPNKQEIQTMMKYIKDHTLESKEFEQWLKGDKKV